jgi:chromatin segregation and condensation protein Rec8/ScpA/Scc1 (kleisin family)
MSEWTDRGQIKANSIIPRALKKLDDKKLSSQMDRDGLANELHEYKKFSLQQYE